MYTSFLVSKQKNKRLVSSEEEDELAIFTGGEVDIDGVGAGALALGAGIALVRVTPRLYLPPRQGLKRNYMPAHPIGGSAGCVGRTRRSGFRDSSSRSLSSHDRNSGRKGLRETCTWAGGMAVRTSGPRTRFFASTSMTLGSKRDRLLGDRGTRRRNWTGVGSSLFLSRSRSTAVPSWAARRVTGHRKLLWNTSFREQEIEISGSVERDGTGRHISPPVRFFF